MAGRVKALSGPIRTQGFTETTSGVYVGINLTGGRGGAKAGKIINKRSGGDTNFGLTLTQKRPIIIDNDIRARKEFVSGMRQIARKRPGLLLNTHHNFDHTSDNAYYHKQGAVSFGTSWTRKEMEREQEAGIWVNQMAGRILKVEHLIGKIGVAAPEAANNAVAGGALVPMMTLGIPGDPITAILIGALLFHGLAPGPLLFMEQAPFAYTIIFSFFWANIFNLIIALIGLRLLVRVLSMPQPLLLPTISVLCVIGSYALRNSFFDVYVMFVFGLLGLFMRWFQMPIVPLLLALVLGKQLEEHLRVALTGSKGDISIFFTSPVSTFFLCLSALSIVWPFVAEKRKKKAAALGTS